MTAAWNLFRAAILPAKLATLPDIVSRLLDHLARSGERWRQRKVDQFIEILNA